MTPTGRPSTVDVVADDAADDDDADELVGGESKACARARTRPDSN